MKIERCLSLPLAAALLIASGSALADEATDAQLRQVDVRKIVLAHGDATGPQTGVFVKRIQTNGQDAKTCLQVLGSNAKAIQLDDLADGATRSFEIGDGKWMEVERDGDVLRLDIDGEQVEVPLDPGGHGGFPELAQLHGLDGAKRVEVFMMSDEEAPSFLTSSAVMTFVDEDGTVQHPALDDDFTWTEEAEAQGHRPRKVIVKCLETDGAEEESVQVMALPAFPLAGLSHQAPDFESLESLRDADPEVRAKVIEALKEILSQHHAVQLHVEVDGEVGEAQEGSLRHAKAPRAYTVR